jgi:hypothetical protein
MMTKADKLFAPLFQAHHKVIPLASSPSPSLADLQRQQQQQQQHQITDIATVCQQLREQHELKPSDVALHFLCVDEFHSSPSLIHLLRQLRINRYARPRDIVMPLLSGTNAFQLSRYLSPPEGRVENVYLPPMLATECLRFVETHSDLVQHYLRVRSSLPSTLPGRTDQFSLPL